MAAGSVAYYTDADPPQSRRFRPTSRALIDLRVGDLNGEYVEDLKTEREVRAFRLNIHKNGSITDVAVATPCPIEGYNTAAFGALKASNPTQPLPPEYPTDKAFFTITFFCNEHPLDQ